MCDIMQKNDDSSDEEVAELRRQHEEQMKQSNACALNQNKLILYESDNGGLYNVPVDQAMSMTAPTANPQLGYQKLLMEKQMLEKENENR